MNDLKKYYYVMRTYSHTDKQQLWKVVSRRIKNKNDAETWKELCEKTEKNKKHNFFIISKKE